VRQLIQAGCEIPARWWKPQPPKLDQDSLTKANRARDKALKEAKAIPDASRLFHAETGVPIARLRPIGRDNLVDIIYWSLWKERWAPFGPFGRTAAPVDGRAHHRGSGNLLGRHLKQAGKIR
jgi:hypothetical protein